MAPPPADGDAAEGDADPAANEDAEEEKEDGDRGDDEDDEDDEEEFDPEAEEEEEEEEDGAAAFGAALTAGLARVSIDERDREGHTPLHVALLHGSIDCVNALLDAGAK